MNEKKSTGWSSVRRKLTDWPRPALIALVKDLYKSSAQNRDFLHARFQAEENSGEALEKYRQRIVEQFFPKRGFGKLKLGEARKAISEYRKATGNIVGTIDLMLTYVENGTEFARQFGNDNGAFYVSLTSVLFELSKLLLGEDRSVYEKFRDRIRHLDEFSDRIGWGYGDALREQVYYLESELRESSEDDEENEARIDTNNAASNIVSLKHPKPL